MTSPRPVPSRLAFLICSLASQTCPLRRLRVIGPSVRDFTSALRGWFSGGDAPWYRASRSGFRTPAFSLGGARLVWYPSFFFQAEDGIRDYKVTGVQTCALPI